MRFRLLGSVQVWDGADWLSVRAAQQRIVLAVLLIEAGRIVTTDRLVEEIWGEQPPRRAVLTVQGYVHRLRRLLGGNTAPLVTRTYGYELQVDDSEVDAHAFTRLIATGQRDLADGRFDTAADRLAEALDLWRGPPLADVPPGRTVAAHIACLEKARITALEERFAALLELGRHAEVAVEARRLVADYPLRERLRAQLILALYRCGQRGEALDAYQDAYRAVTAELGVAPGPQVRDLHRAILADAPGLNLPTSGPVTVRVVPAQLPATAAGFTGREEHLGRLDALLAYKDQPHPVPAIGAITGPAGVGKTALAVCWAHRVVSRFPDGQLYVNLHGYAAGPPQRPIAALARFLRALGVPTGDVPGELEEAAALYRSLLAGRHMLVLLDNAGHADQVRPLLPGTPTCLVLITSRDQLRGLRARDGAVPLTVDVLTPEQSRRLLARLLGPARASADPASTGELARLCGDLPLALRIAAAALAARPRMSVADYVDHLRGADRLTSLTLDGDSEAGVRTAFDNS